MEDLAIKEIISPLNLPNEEFLSPPDMLKKWVNQTPNDVFLKQMVDRKFKQFTYAEVFEKALRLVTALQKLGLKQGDKVGLLSKNCAEWFICDLAFMMGKFISVPIFPTAGEKTISYCLTHSETKALIIGKLDDTQAIEDAVSCLPDLITISLPYKQTPRCQYSFDDLIKQSSPATDISKIEANDLMSIVYTSGTSGPPKGAMLTYGRFMWSVNQLIDCIEISKDDRMFSYLPLAHITERVYIFGVSVVAGLQTAFPESLETFIEDVKQHKPTLFISVPRLWTVFQQNILQKLPQKKLNILLKIPFINSLIKKKIIAGLGLDQARVLGCGSAPVSTALLKWYHSIGINITEAWGMTESFAYSTLNYPFRYDKIGTVGRMGNGIEVKIAEDGEILVHSEGLFSGYYKDQTATEATFDQNGWLKTGDQGSLDEDGYLTIIGRMKDSFKTAKGKFVTPSTIEKMFWSKAEAEMLCLIGAGLTAPIMLVVPPSYKEFDKKRYEKHLLKVLDWVNAELESHEKLAGIVVMNEAWSIENNILTPTLKIKRFALDQKYHDFCQEWPENTLIRWG